MSRRRRPTHGRTVLNNGLTIVTERCPEFRSLSMGVWVKAGTRNERPHEAGISHFLEHMLFKGTSRRKALDIAREVDRVGGEFNAATARDYTCFDILLLDRDLALGADILSDVLLHSTFDAGEMERERKVILQEIAMIEESPEELAHDLHYEMVYGRHGLGRPILGTEASIRRLRRGDLMRYFHRHYRPDQLVIAVAGDVSHQAVVKNFRAFTRHDWPGRPRGRGSRRDLGFVPAPSPRAGSWWVRRPTEQVHIVWGVEGPRHGARDRYAAHVLNVYLGGGMSSELFQQIREKHGLAYTVYSGMSSYADSGLFTIYAATSPARVPLCLRLIEETVARARRELLSEEALREVKENIKGNILLGEDSAEARMATIARGELVLGEPLSLEAVLKAIDDVRPEDVRRVARRLFGHGERSLLMLGPRPSVSVRAKLPGIQLTKR